MIPATARPWKHLKSGVDEFRRRVLGRPLTIIGNREGKRSLGTKG
ncbi:hypothetical protein [Microvirga roseola]|nr:hypothetical protein [Microvirga roseola]